MKNKTKQNPAAHIDRKHPSKLDFYIKPNQTGPNSRKSAIEVTFHLPSKKLSEGECEKPDAMTEYCNEERWVTVACPYNPARGATGHAPAGMYCAPSQAEANLIAQDAAREQAENQLYCIVDVGFKFPLAQGNPPSNQGYSGIITLETLSGDPAGAEAWSAGGEVSFSLEDGLGYKWTADIWDSNGETVTGSPKHGTFNAAENYVVTINT